jgi:hypothetical protein
VKGYRESIQSYFAGMSKFSSSKKGKKDKDLLVVGQKPPAVWTGGGCIDKNVKIQYKWNEDEMFVGTVKAKLGKKVQVHRVHQLCSVTTLRSFLSFSE